MFSSFLQFNHSPTLFVDTFVVQANVSITDKFICCFFSTRGGFVALSPISPQDLFMQPLAQDSMEEREEYQHHYHLHSMVGKLNPKYTNKCISSQTYWHSNPWHVLHFIHCFTYVHEIPDSCFVLWNNIQIHYLFKILKQYEFQLMLSV